MTRIAGTGIWMALSIFATTAVPGETVAVWLFDEPIEAPAGTLLKDASGNGYHLTLGSGTIVADGKFGHGLLCPAVVPDYVACRPHVENTDLNLSNSD